MERHDFLHRRDYREPVSSAADERVSLGRYRLLSAIGAGGMGRIHLACDEIEGELCVVKSVLPHLWANDGVQARFRREARVLGHLDHPNLARAFRASVEEPGGAIAFELVLGQTLRALIWRAKERGARVPGTVALGILVQVLDGLAHAHAACDENGTPLGLVHRDLTPVNVMVGYDGVVKVIDFGVAYVKVDDYRTKVGHSIGTPRYVSPEQASGSPVDARSDLYSITSTFYEVLEGKRYVEGDNLAAQLFAIVSAPKPTVDIFEVTDLPHSVLEVLVRALEKEPKQRWSSAAEYRAAIEASGAPIATSEEVGAFVSHWFAEEQKETEASIEALVLSEVMPTKNARRETFFERPPIVRTVVRRASSAPVLTTKPMAPPPVKKRSRSALLFFVAAITVAAAIVTGFTVRFGDRPAPPPPRSAPAATPVLAVPAPTAETSPAPEPAPPAAPKTKRDVRRAPPPPAEPAPAPAPAPPRKQDPLDRSLAALRATPNDAALFHRVATEIERRGRAQPDATRRAIQAQLDAANITQDVEALARARALLPSNR